MKTRFHSHFILSSLIGVICMLHSCTPDKIQIVADPPPSSPINTSTRDTGRTAENLVWRDNAQMQSVIFRMQENVPLAALYCTRIMQMYSPTPEKMREEGYAAAIFSTSRAKSVRISAGGSGYGNVLLVGERGDFVSIPMLNMNIVDTGTPLIFRIDGYTPSDSVIAWLERVQITSPLPLERTDSLPGEFLHLPTKPLLITWDKAIATADSGEIVIRGAGLPPIRKPISRTATRLEIPADDWKNFDPRGHHFSVTVRFYRAKSYENNTLVLVASTESTVLGVIKQ